MTNKSPQKKKQISPTIIAALIGLIGICIATIGTIIVGVFPEVISILTSNTQNIATSTLPVSFTDNQSTSVVYTVPSSPTTETPPNPPTSTPIETTAIIIYDNGEFRNTTSENFTFRVVKIELNANGKMRWYFEFWNKSDKPVLFGLNYSNTVLADEFGNKYDVLDASTYPNKTFEESIAAGVLYNLWIDFNSPINNAKKFNATLIPANQYWHPSYGLFEININYDASKTPSAPVSTLASDSSILFENGDFLNTSFSDFIFRVTRVDLRPNNKMRWYFDFWNQSDEAASFGLDHARITLADENGHQYTVLDASTYPNKIFEINVAAGVLYKHWIEFDAPVDNSKIFKVTLTPANYYWHPRYDVFTVNFK